MLDIELAGLNLKNPLILASGILSGNSSALNLVIDNGIGAVTTKSIGIAPREGYENPALIPLEHGLLNAIGLSNPGVDQFKIELEETDRKVPIIASIFGKSADEFIELSRKMEECNVDAIELNLSCPHAKGYGLDLAKPEMVHEIVENVKEDSSLPLFVKLSPDSDLISIGKACEDAGADGVVAINTVKALAIDINLRRPILTSITGGYSGPGILPIGLRCVYELAKNLNIPVIGVGGITSGEDVIEYMMAGAQAVQVGSAFYYRGLDAPKLIIKEILGWMELEGVESLDEIIGCAQVQKYER